MADKSKKITDSKGVSKVLTSETILFDTVNGIEIKADYYQCNDKEYCRRMIEDSIRSGRLVFVEDKDFFTKQKEFIQAAISEVKGLREMVKDNPIMSANLDSQIKGWKERLYELNKERKSNVHEEKLKAIRVAVANYVASEGCTCCQNIEEHEKAANQLGELLEFTPYDDGSGYDFYEFKSY
jgi:hypothetical protein